MVRGCQKKIIYVKNTDSKVFDEAYFVLSDKIPEATEECDMVEEANRILGECVSYKEKRRIFATVKNIFKDKISILFAGIIIGIVLVLLIT